MVSLTLSIPLKLKKKMKRYSYVKWSDVVRSVLQQQIDEFEEAEHLATKSRLTEEDVEYFASKVDDNMAKHFQRLHKHATSG